MEHYPVQRPVDDSRTSLIPEPSGALTSPRYVDWYQTDDGEEWSRWIGYLTVLRRRKVMLATAACCGAALAFAYSVFQPPEFVAATSMEFQSQSMSEPPFEGISFLGTSDPTALQTQSQVLRSRRLQERVYESLLAARTGTELAASAVGAAPLPNRLVGAVRRWLGVPWTTPTWQDGLEQARSTLRVVPVKDTQIVQISAAAEVPGVASDYVNTLADEYIKFALEERWRLYQSAGDWLDRAQEELKGKLEAAERQLLAYASESGLIVTSKDQPIAEQRLVDVQAEASRAQADRIAKEALYRTAAAQSSPMLPSRADGGQFSQYDAKLADLRRELADVTTTLLPAHPKVQRLEAQIADMESTKQRESLSVVQRMRSDYQAALRREQQLTSELALRSKALSESDQKLIRYHMLQREADTYRRLYETTLQRGKEASVASALRPVNARVVDSAPAATVPSEPNVTMNLAFGLFGGLMMGAGLTVVRERADLRIRRPASVGPYLNVRELGVIPTSNHDGALLGSSNRRVLRLPSTWPFGGAALPAGSEPVELATWNRKISTLAESFRATLTSILAARQQGVEPQVILVTSPVPREGKSTVITNLGIALAEIHQRVLLIDGDLRRPRLHTIFDQANTWGLTDLLRESTPCEQYQAEALARKTHVPRLFLLPSGPGSVNLFRLLHSPRFVELVQRFRAEFDAILIDSPPVLRAADARILARLADAIVLVVRAGQTTREAATAALTVLEEDGVPVLGTVLNGWDPRVTGYDSYSAVAVPYADEREA